MKFLCLLLFAFKAYAQITCTHPQVCNLYFANAKNPQNMEVPIDYSVDPHHYSPTPQIIKTLISAKILITPPIELQPWLKNIIQERNKKKLPTLSLSFLKDNSKLSNNTLSHYWLNSKSICFNSLSMRNFLKQNAIELKEFNCGYHEQFSKASHKTIILSHDPIMVSLNNIAKKIIALKSSEEFSEINSKTIKEIMNLPDSKEVIWILEKNIQIDKNILKLKKPNHELISFDLDGFLYEEPFFRIKQLEKIFK